MLRHFRSALKTVAWVFLLGAWLLSIVFPITNISDGNIWTASNAASFVFAGTISFMFVKKWIVILPGILLYGVLHFIVLFVTGRYPKSWSELEMAYIMILGAIGIFVFLKFQDIDIDLFDRLLLTGFSVFVFIPIGLDWPPGLSTMVLMVPIAIVALRRIEVKGGRLMWSPSRRWTFKVG